MRSREKLELIGYAAIIAIAVLHVVVLGLQLLPSRVWLAIWSAVMVVGNLLVWAASGGAVIGMAVWAIPAVLIALSVILVWTSTIGGIILGLVLLVPVSAGIFDSIHRLFGKYVDWATSPLVYRALSPSDRSTLLHLRAATRRPSAPNVSMRLVQ